MGSRVENPATARVVMADIPYRLHYTYEYNLR
jgi:hypothetical protein